MKILSTGLKLFCLLVIFAGCKKDHTPSPGFASMPTARHNFGFVECNGLLYAIGGYNADGLDKVEVYDPASNSWATKAPMPTARGWLVVAVVANKIYAIGGITGSNLDNITYINATEEYDPATDTWTEKSALPITVIPPNNVLGNEFITGSAINGKIYVAAGYSGGEVPTYIYDPVTDTWSTGKSIGKFNNEPYFSAASDNDLYVSDGFNFLQYLSDGDEWRELALESTHTRGSCFAYYNGNIYSIGGYEMGIDLVTNLSNVEIYNIANSLWSRARTLHTARHSAAAVVYNGNLYVAGGAVKQANFTDVPISDLEVISLK